MSVGSAVWRLSPLPPGIVEQVQLAVATRFPLGPKMSHWMKPILNPRSMTLASARMTPVVTGRMKLIFRSMVEKSSPGKSVLPKAIPIAASAKAAIKPP